MCGSVIQSGIVSVVIVLLQIINDHGISTKYYRVGAATQPAFRAWGSGLRAEQDTPAQYIYIQHLGSQKLQKNKFSIQISHTTLNNKKSNIKFKFWDHGDGVYSAQYVSQRQAKSLSVTLQYDGKHIAKSPYVLEGPISVEKCRCPRPDTTFLADYECESSDPARQIDKDMANFPEGLVRADFDKAIEELNLNETSLMHYTFKDNKIYSKNYGKYGGFSKFVNEMLITLNRKVVLPDMEFLLNMGDWPKSYRFDQLTGKQKTPIPVFSWCGSDNNFDMVLPTYKLVQAGVFGKDVENVQEVDGKSYMVGGAWSSKQPKVYFRGRPSNKARVDGMVMAKNDPELDIAISKNHFNYFPDEEAKKEHVRFEKKYGRKADRDDFVSAFKNKYQLNIDGTVAAYRFPALIAGNSVVIKQYSDYYEHFYKALHPWEHFIPVNRDLSDLKEKLEWAKKNDAKAEQIAINARNFARKHLRVEDVYCYHLLAFTRFAALQKFTPEVHPGMVEVTDDTAQPCVCPERFKYPRVRKSQTDL
eukprot:m.172888 g.172888  ORF g.172888 m.172888 type:complete len:530 (-) comp15378_c0_seq2:937-2526(-)